MPGSRGESIDVFKRLLPRRTRRSRRINWIQKYLRALRVLRGEYLLELLGDKASFCRIHQLLPPFEKRGGIHQLLPPLKKGGWGGFMVDALSLIPPTNSAHPMKR